MRRSFLAVTTVALLAICGSAQAALVTVGPTLSGTYTAQSCAVACTLANGSLTESGVDLVSPVTGAIVRWHVIQGATAGEYKLRTMNVIGSGSYLFTGTSPSVASTPTAGIQTFSAALPIKAGQAIGLDMSATASIGLSSTLGTFVQWEPVPAEGSSPTPAQTAGPDAIGFNAEVQPAPTITQLGDATGSTAGGATVTITGTDLEGASAVEFGPVPASGFTVDSEGSSPRSRPPEVGRSRYR